MKKTKKGFTLVELVIVVAVMAVLVAVAIPTVSAITESAKSSVNQTNAQTIESMIKLHLADVELQANDGDESTSLTKSATDIATALNNKDLGITSAIFDYDGTTGICEYIDSVPGTLETGHVYITFNSAGIASGQGALPTS